MPIERDHPELDAAEGSRDVVERELKRQDKASNAAPGKPDATGEMPGAPVQGVDARLSGAESGSKWLSGTRPAP